ncbi:glycosyltransferase family 4 protein [Candidatus Peribacteria bacterium]|jgi:glycosyltransferase involved in cell wall biosynthesis|nr:glycosyltransferase family 4 protein [Candidatus Peribacteria bacterium]MBT4021178.1 glycosyltransferase family 4 protein [Candidatus Peribacteria bacterium]MBT4240954.1 glycosyltransferase family 4 protein [Candidatus Peribacteria bacterium]MBT4474597.1 glycosyltransferase family 4 protein [Candidatus Peribacteria bacterium]
MKILILNDDFPPNCDGGAGQIASQLAEGYVEQGHEVDVLTAISGKRLAISSPYKISYIPISYDSRWRAYLSIWNPKASKLIKKFFKENGSYDIVHAHNVHQLLTYNSLKIAKKHAKKVVITFHDVMSFSYGRLATDKYLKNFNYKLSFIDHIKQAGILWNPLRNFFIKRILKKVDVKIAVSHALKDALEANGIEIDDVIYNGIDLPSSTESVLRRTSGEAPLDSALCEEPHSRKASDKQTIFFGGRMNRDKGLYQLLDAFRLIKSSHPEASIVIAGDKSKAEALTNKYRHSEDLVDKIKFTGKLRRKEFIEAISNCDICVTPSICFDSFPTVNLEAMALGKPVIATHYGGSKELILDEQTGFIVDPFDTKTFAKKLDYLLSDRNRAIEMGKAGRKLIEEKFSLEKQIENYLKFFQT